MHIFKYFILRAIRPYRIHINANEIEKNSIGKLKAAKKKKSITIIHFLLYATKNLHFYTTLPLLISFSAQLQTQVPLCTIITVHNRAIG